MGWSCRGCGEFRARVGVSSCKPSKVCKEIDVSLPSHRPKLQLQQYRELHRLLWANYEAAGRFASLQPIPRTPEAFQQLIRELHRRIFSSSLPEIAGRYRQGPVYFGAYEGCNHNLLESRMNDVFAMCGFADVDVSTISRDRFVRTVSVFLEAFFMVHPFADGNGRVARLFTFLLCHRSQRWVFGLDRGGEGNYRKQRKYWRALNWAHDALPQHNAPASRPRRHPYLLLDRWLDERLKDVVPDSELVEVPPSADDQTGPASNSTTRATDSKQ